MTDGSQDAVQTPTDWERWEREQLDALASALRTARRSRGLSIHKLAIASGLDRGRLTNIEHGSARLRCLPSVTIIVALAQTLGVAVGDLLPGLNTGDRALLAVANGQLAAIRRVLGGAR